MTDVITRNRRRRMARNQRSTGPRGMQRLRRKPLAHWWQEEEEGDA